MPYECPSWQEAAAEFIALTDEAKTQLRCRLVDSLP